MTQNKNGKDFDWAGKSVLVTGGASFIGSHVVDRLVERGVSHVRVVDDLSSGTVENIRGHIDSGVVELVRADLLAPGATDEACAGIDYVFHLAAIHGGRGYVEMHDAECGRNLVIDGLMVKSSIDAGVDKFVFASSGCVYPNYIQQDISKELYLTEEMVGPPYDSDHMYGWAKLMCELSLQSFHRDRGFKSVSCRLFTVYGERGVENHAVIAMIARAFIGQNRVASNKRAKELIGWSPKMKFFDGLHRTVDWYFSTKDPEVVRGYFGRMLTERGESTPEPAGSGRRR